MHVIAATARLLVPLRLATGRSPAMTLVLAMALAATLALGGCSDDGEDAPADTLDAGPVDGSEAGDGGLDVPGPGQRDGSWLRLEGTLANGNPVSLDVTLDPLQHVSFGSTHIAPAVSLAVEYSRQFPTFLVANINPGIVVGSGEYSVQCDEVGEYPFGALPPSLSLDAEGVTYRSTVDGATGSMTVTSWTTTPGQPFEAVFSGRLLQDADVEPKLFVDVEGAFRVELPQPQNGS